jgi:class 3 adenylate cyclase
LALALHDQILRQAIDSHGGYVFATAGDSFAVAFDTASVALEAAMSAQALMRQATFPDGVELRIRTGLHTGTADERDGDYFGRDVSQAARVMDAGHGGQILLSEATASLVPGLEVIDHGEHVFRDLESSVHVLEVAMPSDRRFPPLRTLSALRTNLPN